MSDPRLRLSSFAVVLPLGGDRAFVGHAVRGGPLVCDGAVGAVVQALATATSTSELESVLADDERFSESPGALVAIVEQLRDRGIVTSSTHEEEVLETRRFVEATHLGPGTGAIRARMRAEFAPAEHWQGAPPQRAQRAVVLGWCTAEALGPALRQEARARGVSLEVVTGFESDSQLARDHDADFTLLVLGNFRLLAPLFGCGPAEAAARALETAISECGHLVREAARHTRGVLLVSGCVSPQAEPLGLAAALCDDSASDRIVALNRGIRRAVAGVPGAVYVDLERLFGNEGKASLLDDLVAPWAHAGVAGGASNPRYHQLVARACFDALDARAGTRHIRLVAVDLDGVLWPGEIAEPEFSFQDPSRVQSLLYGTHGGIHEALRALGARGILLAVVSKNVRASVLEKWNAATIGELGPNLLCPGDFAALKLDWTEKSQALAQLSAELGVSPAAMAFLDDSPLERAEVSHALPAVWVLDVPLEQLRETLLTSPRFESLEQSPEARARTETTQARLLRDRALDRADDRAGFLAGLGVVCTLRTAHDARALDRAAELVARTNQFRTTAERPSRREVEAFAQDPSASVITLEVSDRFGSYGVTGVALTRAGELRLLTLSCRVIGADVHHVLFRAALEACRARAPGADVLVCFSDTPDNAPTKRLFEAAELVEHPNGRVLPASAALPPFPGHCQVASEPSQR
ncbi:MAG: hypothetical protein IPM35_30035 [Myxococcales bacterium]|nr:hypothetical protein [Myxococcales bacterium]